MFYLLQNDVPAAMPIEEALPFVCERGHVISLVGGGGKTTLLYRLAQEMSAHMRVLVTTTTHIVDPRENRAESLADCEALWREKRWAVIGAPAKENKLSRPPDALLRDCMMRADAVLIEADGAKRKSCKAPAAHEPVLLPDCDIVLGVVGIRVLDQPIETACFRAAEVCRVLHRSLTDCLTESDLARLLNDPQGTKKAVGERQYYRIINQCDNASLLARGAAVLRETGGNGVLTCLWKGVSE